MDKKDFECINRRSLWSEISYKYSSLIYSPFGSSTIDVPKFHRKNLKDIAENLPSVNFQYNIYSNELKESVHKYLPKHIFGRDITKEEIIITPGAVKSMHLIMSTFLDMENEEIIIFQPFYLCHLTDLLWKGYKNFKIVNRKYIYNIEDNHENNKLIQNYLSIDFEDLESKLNDKTKFIILVNPDNPTTHLHNKSELKKLSDLLEQKYPNVLVIEDMAYFAYINSSNNNEENNLTSFSNLSEKNIEKTFSVFSAGKLFNITGLRCGWTIGPKNLLEKIQISIEMTFSFTSPIESICIAENLKDAITEKFEDCENFYEWVKLDQNNRLNYLIEFLLSNFSLKIINPEGSYYLLIDISCYKTLTLKCDIT